jgi:hypothetical protein
MVWELEHQEQVAVEDGARPALRVRFSLDKRKAMIYAALALVPVVLFVVMLVLARR